MPIPRLSQYNGPALLSYGFRPFFLLGALYSGFSVLLWLPMFYDGLELNTLFVPVDWHVHELYFGFLAAIISGFLFTAIPNWTGRLPLQGKPLLLLVLLWVAGRFIITFSTFVGWQIAMVLDVSFLAMIIVVVAREIIAGKNWRNLKVLMPLVILFVANVIFHFEAHSNGVSNVSRRLALLAAITLIIVIGGRIIPSFTRNWLARQNPGRLPVPFNKFDIAVICISVISMAFWCVYPTPKIIGIMLALAGILQFIRLARWAGYRAVREPLVLVLHVSYLFVPIGFALLAISIIFPERLAQLAGVHALTVGAIGGMALSVMVRSSLGHTGQETVAGPVSIIMFIAIFTAALARIAAAIDIGGHDVLLHIAAFAWLFAFISFAGYFLPTFMRPRITARP